MTERSPQERDVGLKLDHQRFRVLQRARGVDGRGGRPPWPALERQTGLRSGPDVQKVCKSTRIVAATWVISLRGSLTSVARAAITDLIAGSGREN